MNKFDTKSQKSWTKIFSTYWRKSVFRRFHYSPQLSLTWYSHMLLNMTKALISEILTMEAHGAIPEMTKKPEIFEFFSIFDLETKFFWKILYFVLLHFLLRVFWRQNYLNRFSNLEDMKNDQKNTLVPFLENFFVFGLFIYRLIIVRDDYKILWFFFLHGLRFLLWLSDDRWFFYLFTFLGLLTFP